MEPLILLKFEEEICGKRFEVNGYMEVFQDYAYYYNAFYKDKDYKAEALQVKQLIEKAVAAGGVGAQGKDIKSIINFGCGTGRHDIELAKLGYDMTGIDLSADMIKIATENSMKEGFDIPFSVQNVCDFTPDKKYDCVISLFHVMSYLNDNEALISAFKNARKSLDKGGIFVFDSWYGPGVLTDLPSVRIKETEDEKYKLIRLARPVLHDKKNVVDVCYEVLVIDKKTSETKTINEVHNMRYFFRPEIELMLSLAGFELIDNYDCNTLGETGYESWTSYFAARAI